MTFAKALARITEEINTGNLTPHEVAELLDRRRIETALKRFDWNQVAAAESIGMHRNSLSRRMEALGITVPDNATPKKHGRRPGRPLSVDGRKARGFGMRPDRLRASGLDREISPLVMRIRLKQIERAARKTSRIDSLMALSEKVQALAAAAGARQA